MKLIGLTGGIGMGKSTSARLLGEFGVAVVDTDILARNLVQPGQPALAEIKAQFGIEVFQSDGQLNRAVLAQKVFSDPATRKVLEDILHPRIRNLWKQQIEQWKNEGRNHGVVVIPLLFETAAETEFESVVCVACSAATQKRRLFERGWNEAEITNRLAAQWSVEKKIAQATFVVWTDTSVKVHAAQLERIFKT